ncbi:MAG TPA: serine--tRNA ligase [Gemmatimonadales bacterium]
MLDVRLIRESPDEVRRALARRGAELVPAVDRILELDTERRALLQRVEALKAERNRQSEEVARRRKGGEIADDLLESLKALSEDIKQIDPQVRTVEELLEGELLSLPNLPLPVVPDGDASANVVERTWGEIPDFAFAPRSHWDLGERLGILDLPRGAKVTGTGFPVLTGAGARLSRALVNYMLDLHTTRHGYREVAPPFLVNAASARGTGQLPDLEQNMYVTEDGLYLVPTAEVPVTNLHRDELLRAEDLPVAWVAYTPCFRREAGAHGKETRGLIRVHQFDKVELVRLCTPESSAEEHQRILQHAEAVLQDLALPYRVVMLAAGDLGFASGCTYDLEVWAPGVGMWLEVSSASTFGGFQARRANIRYRPAAGGKPAFVHTLNASGLALPRTIIGLLENNQRADGSVQLPAPLVPYAGMERLVPPGA